jgi:dihydroorotate dehydrogenase
MYPLIKPFLFLFDPESAHHFVFKSLKLILKFPGIAWIWKKNYVIENPKLERTVFGITFKNPIGLAAGFDKDAKLYKELSFCGFGFIEVGTVTPIAQYGNPKKRLFRLKKDKALINRMGFNNLGVSQMVERLKKNNHQVIIGGNIGKNKLTPNDQAISDYIKCFKELFDYVDYFVVNVSSPNTPNLRDLQEKEPLTRLLKELMQTNASYKKQKPILLKIAPDLSDEQLNDIIEIVKDTKIAGVIATNTTISRANLNGNVEKIGAGGLSGKPLTNRSTEVIRYLYEKSNKTMDIIGVGGIHSPEDAIEKLEAGAKLIQLYTGFVYEGPGLVKRINKSILKST